MGDLLRRVAVVQAAPVAFDTSRTLDRVGELVAGAAEWGVDLVVFPEAFVGGYPKGADFGARVGTRDSKGREWFRRYHEQAIELPGSELERLGEIAASHRVHLVIGVVEREGGTLYCTVVYLDDRGRYLGKHRKLMPTAMERLIWGFGDGSTLEPVKTKIGTIGAAICWENYMPLLRASLYARGVELYCAPTVDDRDVWSASMRHIAVEGRCYVLAACQFATRADYPDDFESSFDDDPRTVLIRGGSMIVDPFGEVIAGPTYGETVTLSATIDLGSIPRGKFDLDTVGHYARPDVFQLQVNATKQESIVFGDEDSREE